MKKQAFVLLLACLIVAGCATTPTPKSAEKKAVLDAEVTEAISIFKTKVPDTKVYFDGAVAYAVFPKVLKAAFFVGGLYGRGQVFRGDQLIGYSLKRGGSLGLSFGGQYFREIIFFENEQALSRFQADEFAFSAEMSAVAASAGVGTKASYKNGMAVFVLTDTGLMADASVGGQRFNYSGVEEGEK